MCHRTPAGHAGVKRRERDLERHRCAHRRGVLWVSPRPATRRAPTPRPAMAPTAATAPQNDENAEFIGFQDEPDALVALHRRSWRPGAGRGSASPAEVPSALTRSLNFCGDSRVTPRPLPKAMTTLRSCTRERERRGPTPSVSPRSLTISSCRKLTGDVGRWPSKQHPASICGSGHQAVSLQFAQRLADLWP